MGSRTWGDIPELRRMPYALSPLPGRPGSLLVGQGAVVLLSAEGRRAARRYGRLASTRASMALTAITLLALDQPIIEIAGELEPAELRSLDALHLATILSLGDDIECVYCYDSRLTSAARTLGIEVAQPGMGEASLHARKP